MLMAASTRRDSHFPTLSLALDPVEAASAIGRDVFGSDALSVEIERVRLKPGRKALIGYRVTGQGIDQRMMVTLWPGGDLARLPKTNGQEGLELPNLLASAWLFPHDRKIVHIADLIAQGRQHGAVDIIHYVPEQGCTVRAGKLYGKVRADDRCAVAARFGRVTPVGIRLAPIVSHDPDKRILWQQAVQGEPVLLSALVGQADVWAPRIAAAISAFQALPQPSGLTSLTVKSIARTITGRIARTASIMPDLDHQLAHLAERLQSLRSPETPLTLAHCDLHPTNLLWDGQSFALIDLDTAALAPAALDYGTLVASIAHRALDAETSVDRIAAMIDLFRAAAAHPHFDWFLAASLLGERLYRCGTRLKSRAFVTRNALVELAAASLDRMER